MARIKIGNVRTPIDYLKQVFAPAGYTASYYTAGSNEEIDSILKSAIDKLKSYEKCHIDLAVVHSDLDLTSDNWMCLLEKAYGDRCIITATGSVYIAMRYYENGVFTSWAWHNPPMAIGVEYRTTERFKDKPVYRKIVAYKLPSTTNTDFSVPHGISNFDTLVRQTASVGAGVPLPYTHNGNTTCVKELDATNIKVSNSGQSWDTSYTWNFYLYYTKTTD